MAKSIGSVLITGANRGIGLEFVKQIVRFSNAPQHIFALCRNPNSADELQAVAKSNPYVHILKAGWQVCSRNQEPKNSSPVPSAKKQLMPSPVSYQTSEAAPTPVFSHPASEVTLASLNLPSDSPLFKNSASNDEKLTFTIKSCNLFHSNKDLGKNNLTTLLLKDFKSFPAIVQQVKDKVGDAGLNLLINNAGIALRDEIDDLCYEHLMENFEVNVVLPLLLSKEFIPLLKTAASKIGGSSLSGSRAAIVNITSKMGSIDDNTSGGCYPYRISKTALNMGTKSLAVDLKPHGILVVALHPGWVLTDMGGPNALIDTKTSVSSMLDVIVKATDEQAGLMLNYDGKPIPW